MDYIPRVKAEDVGVSPDSIKCFVKRLEDLKLPMHSILIARHRQLIYEAYYEPYKEDSLHRMYSISKSFISIAVGLLVDERRISLEDPIIKYFPEKLPGDLHPWIKEMTIKDMLCMKTCHYKTTYKEDLTRDWVESFFITKPHHEPGTIFRYDTSSSHTLCALVEKLTKKPILDYMREKFLEEIGFSKEAYMLKDPFGISMGGSGLVATPMDIMKFALLIMNDGRLGERQLVPAWYIKEATSHQTDNKVEGAIFEETLGYGYQFWCISHGGFACYGLGGQLAICLPKQDIICITTADTTCIKDGNQYIYDSLYEEILPFLI